MGQDVLEALARARDADETVVMGTTVRTEGDPPSAPGNRALFAEDGRLLAGTIGCNGLDRRTGLDAAALLGAGERTGMRSYTSFEGEPGEGVVEVFLEAFGGRPRLVVGSGGPVAEMLATLGGHLGLTVTTEPAVASPGFARELGALGPRDAVVFVDHDAEGLLPAVRQALAGGAGYVGVMGSRPHARLRRRVARRRGGPPPPAQPDRPRHRRQGPARDRPVDPRRGHRRRPRPHRRQPRHRQHARLSAALSPPNRRPPPVQGIAQRVIQQGFTHRTSHREPSERE